MRHVLGAALLLAAAGAAALALRSTQETAPGVLVIVGGGLNRENEAVYRAILDARQGAGPLCVIPTASGAPAGTMEGTVATFEQHGGPGSARGVLVTVAEPGAADDPQVAASLRACGGFFFTGGVQSRITAAFLPDGRATPAFEAIRTRWREGAVVSGSSAGAAIMSHPMIAGGSSTGALAEGVRRDDGEGEEDDGEGGVLLARGMGFLPALVDQHFLARGRFGRLLVAVLALEEVDLGFGIDENTALIVEGRTARVAGASGVVIMDGRGAANGVALHLMSEGDRFDLESRRLLLAEDKLPLLPGDGTVFPPDDPFGRWEFLRALDGFARSADPELALRTGGSTLRLRRTGEFRAVHRDPDGVAGTSHGLSVTGLRLELER